jgi:hypothetical protein
MPSITALLHTHNDALRLGRCLETLYPCDEIVILDQGSTDSTLHIAQQYGARVVAVSGIADAHFKPNMREWILCLDPRESLSESLAASLYEWKAESISGDPSFSFLLREETPNGWIEKPRAETRLIPAHGNFWETNPPAAEASARTLEGWLLRFAFP